MALCLASRDDADDIARRSVAVADHEQSQAAAQTEQDKSVLFFGVVRVVDEFRILIGEDGLRIIEAHAALAQVGRRLLGIPLESEHRASVRTTYIHCKPSRGEAVRVAVNLAKRVIQVHAVDAAGHVLNCRALARDEFLAWCAQLPAGCIVAMQTNSGAHHWARKLIALGLDARIIAAQRASPYRQTRRQRRLGGSNRRCPRERNGSCRPQASAPLSGSHLGPHTRPMRPCNKAVSREAVGSFVHALHRRLLIHQPQTCIEVFNNEYEFSLTRWEVPLEVPLKG